MNSNNDGEDQVNQQQEPQIPLQPQSQLPPQIINNGAKKTIEIIVESAEFKKPFNYFIVVQLDGNEEKVIFHFNCLA